MTVVWGWKNIGKTSLLGVFFLPTVEFDKLKELGRWRYWSYSTVSNGYNIARKRAWTYINREEDNRD